MVGPVKRERVVSKNPLQRVLTGRKHLKLLETRLSRLLFRVTPFSRSPPSFTVADSTRQLHAGASVNSARYWSASSIPCCAWL